jgi:hypothetical protein
MNSKLHYHRQNDGSVLVAACIAAGVMFIMIMGMLTYITNEYRLNVRSHKWTQSLNLAEAGVDLAFAEFNNYYMTGTNAFDSSRGWTGSAGTYWYYNPNFTNSFGQNVGVLYAYVYGVGSANPYLFAYGGCTVVTNSQWVYRAVESRLKSSSLFPAAMVAKTNITLSGSAAVDSYDSTDVTKSTGGQYDTAKRQANGSVGSNAGVNAADSMSGSVAIYGNVSTGPGGTVVMSGSTTVGPTTDSSLRSSSVADAETKGYIRHDFAVTIPDVTLPSGVTFVNGGSISFSGSNVGTITDGAWQYTSVNMSGSTKLYINGNVILYTSGAFSTSGSSQINVLPGSSLTVYCGSTFNVSGSGVLNQSGTPAKAQFYGLNTCTAFNYSGSTAWIGTVYAPYATVTMSGSSGGSGALVGKSINFSGSVGFHYDEALRTLNGGAGYLINSWKAYRWNGSAWVSES